MLTLTRRVGINVLWPKSFPSILVWLEDAKGLRSTTTSRDLSRDDLSYGKCLCAISCMFDKNLAHISRPGDSPHGDLLGLQHWILGIIVM